MEEYFADISMIVYSWDVLYELGIIDTKKVVQMV